MENSVELTLHRYKRNINNGFVLYICIGASNICLYIFLALLFSSHAAEVGFFIYVASNFALFSHAEYVVDRTPPEGNLLRINKFPLSRANISIQVIFSLATEKI